MIQSSTVLASWLNSHFSFRCWWDAWFIRPARRACTLSCNENALCNDNERLNFPKWWCHLYPITFDSLAWLITNCPSFCRYKTRLVFWWWWKLLLPLFSFEKASRLHLLLHSYWLLSIVFSSSSDTFTRNVPFLKETTLNLKQSIIDEVT